MHSMMLNVWLIFEGEWRGRVESVYSHLHPPGAAHGVASAAFILYRVLTHWAMALLLCRMIYRVLAGYKDASFC